MENATERSRPRTKVVAAVGAVAAAVVAGSALLDWLGLSVDILSRDEVAITDTELRLMDITGGVVVIVAGLVAAVVSILFLVGLRARKAVAALLIAAMAISIGFVAYTYIARKGVFTDVVADATATEPLPREDVERVVELALRVGGVAVEPRAGMLAAGVAGLVGVASGLTLLRVTPRRASMSDREARATVPPTPPMREPAARDEDEGAAPPTSGQEREADRPTGLGDTWAG